MDYEQDQQQYDDEPRGYDRDRSRSPRDDYRGNGDARARSASPGGRDGRDSRGPPPPVAPPEEDEEAARNTGSNLFVTGIHPRLSEGDVARLFEKYGEVEKCNIMRDPHTKESRGFGFVNMTNGDNADAAKEALQGEVYEGRTLSIEKARRSKPRTPTPGKYFGPPKRDDMRGPPRGGGRFGGGDRYDDRRGYGGGGYGRRDDPYGGYRGGRSYGGGRYDDRAGGDRSYRRDRYEDRPPIDRYASGGRDDRYSSRGGGRDYDRDSRRPPYSDAPPAGGRGYDDAPPAADRYDRR
ncbi:MAG: nuA3 HAT complex component nto1 [Chrysothrix sp. TS-e1954]|nr:MAG: nuA3 HAT complex component nto1 [Chrysothrix sp. TS-e1954]